MLERIGVKKQNHRIIKIQIQKLKLIKQLIAKTKTCLSQVPVKLIFKDFHHCY